MSTQVAGYSGTPLLQKLGIKPGFRIAFANEPEGFRELLGPLPDGTRVLRPDSRGDPLDMIVFFTREAAELRPRFGALGRRVAPNGTLWISWPKRASGVRTDLTEDVVRVIGLEAGMVDVKVCAIDSTWSGLKFVYRLVDRKPGGRPAAVAV